MNRGFTIIIIIAFGCFVCSTGFVYANSSWIWLTDNRPWDILPWVAATTIIIEALALWWIPKTGHLIRVCLTVAVANLASFFIPLGYWYGADRVMFSSFQDYLDKLPYIVSVGTIGAMDYIQMTLLIEIPIVFFSLFFCTEKRKTLLATVIGANIVTTIMVAVIERLYADGIWTA